MVVEYRDDVVRKRDLKKNRKQKRTHGKENDGGTGKAHVETHMQSHTY